MVCNLTIGRPKFAAADAAMRDILANAERRRTRLLELVDDDTLAYPRVISAYRLPRATEEEKLARRDAIQAALVFACEAPMEIARACAAVAELCPAAAQHGNPSAVSDVGVGALLAAAACEGAVLNVTINVGSIRDAQFAAAARQETDDLVARARDARDRAMTLTLSSLKGD
jgi:formiminotetrahydrofolate cyclodeaminase